MTAYEKLKDRFAQINNLENAASILGKDMETVMRPGSSQDRINQIVAIAGASHSLISDPRVADWLNDAESRAASLPDDHDRRNLALMRRIWAHRAGLPENLAQEKARLESEGQALHVMHYKTGNWAVMKDWYKHSFDVMRDIGALKKDLLGLNSVYDALLDEFSPGLNSADIAREFKVLDAELRVMIPQALQNQKAKPAPLALQGPFDSDLQMQLNQLMVSAAGFDTNRGILHLIDGHPSCGGSSDDIRMTTRCDINDPLDSLYSAVHECGHALYGQNLPAAWRYQPAGDHLGMAVHESQSMIIQLQACMTTEFFQFVSEKLQIVFNRAGDPALSAQNLQALMWRATPSFIRVSADELTYPVHILLRHDLEKRMIENTLDVADLPDAWNDGMTQRLGITPPNPAQGCMQDVHWPTGSIGYFPAYTLGAMGAAQFFEAAKAAQPGLLPALGKGDFSLLKDWLVANVHSKGSLVSSEELFRQATGAPLNARAYMVHLRHRYL